MKAATTTVRESPDGSPDQPATRLLVIGRNSYETYVLPDAGTVTIGRAENSDVQIDDPQASRAHARLTTGDTLFVEDLGSINGTRVRDRPITPGEPVAVRSGEPISIGASVLIVHVRFASAAERTSSDGPTYTDSILSAPSAPADPSDRMQAVFRLAERAAAGNINVLILGETGVGKEVMAQAIHRLSPRRDNPYVCINCAALSESLLESELFGHERGAFTGAHAAKPGLMETAATGTLFLDEVGEMPARTQAKLLRVLETREVTRLGSVRPKQIDVRFIAATNRDIESAILSADFRSDLFFRLNGLSLRIPPLRDRRAEIRPLAAKFLRDICREMQRPEPQLSRAVLEALERKPWPGNIRELKNTIERAVLLCAGTTIGLEHLPEERAPAEPVPTAPTGRARTNTPGLSQEQATDRQRILDALASCAGNQSRAAKLLGIPRRTFVARLDKYQIPRPKKNRRSSDDRDD